MAETTIPTKRHNTVYFQVQEYIKTPKLKMSFFLFQCIEKSIIRGFIRGEFFTDFAKKREISRLSREKASKIVSLATKS